MKLHRFYESDVIVKEYIQFRPAYNEEIKKIILENVNKIADREQPYDLMVDVGCGSGQATKLLASCFKKVLARDISQKQIEVAVARNELDHVTYEIGRAEDINVKDHSVDLLISAEAAHWFDLDPFMKEATRILKPNGCLVVMGYFFPKLTPITSGKCRNELTEYATELLEKYMLYGEKYDAARYNEVRNKYCSVFAAMPTNNKHTQEVELVYPEFSLSQFKGFMRSMDSVQNYREFKAKQIQETKGVVTEEDMKPFDVTESFEKEIKAKLDLDEIMEDNIYFRAVFEVVIHVAYGEAAK